MGKVGTNHHEIPTMKHWRHTTEEYGELWNFPTSVGFLEGKHVNMQYPMKAGSGPYNYKGNNFIVLLALVNAKYKLVIIDVRSYGRKQAVAIFFVKSSLGKPLQNET
jgi:hypothetical protein